MLGNELLFSSLFFKIVLEHTIGKVQEKHEGLELNGIHQVLLRADDIYWVET
jgi:hypothetical protein